MYMYNVHYMYSFITNSPFEVLFQLDFVDAFHGLKSVVKEEYILDRDYVHMYYVYVHV